MGLSQPKKRSKLSHDPNNTHWSRSTDRFGHKILVNQGWTPGSRLGAINASHADHLTIGSSSHIRIALKEGNLGLGAKSIRGSADNFGLDSFQGLLGRLNGKSDQDLRLEKEQRRDKRTKLYHAQRWGHMNFVSGGYLVQEDIKFLTEDRSDTNDDAFGEVSRAASLSTASSSPRKASPPKFEEHPNSPASLFSRPRQKGSDQATGETTDAAKEPQVRKKRRKKSDLALANSNVDMSEKDRRKLERRLKKEKKLQRKLEQQQEEKMGEAVISSKRGDPVSEELRPALSKTSTHFANGRFAARQKYVQQKKLASQDSQALKEIFMIKTRT